MSNLSVNQYSRLSDALERDLMSKALSEGESVSIVALTQKALAFANKGLQAYQGFVMDVARSLQDVRTKDVHYSGSQW